MNKLTHDQFQDRVEAVARARKIFIESGITKNISIAFELYQEVLAEQERKLTLNAKKHGTRSRSLIDSFIMPPCPECGADLRLRNIKVPEGKQNVKGWHTCWTCVTGDCVYEEYSKLSPAEQFAKLKKKGGEQDG